MAGSVQSGATSAAPSPRPGQRTWLAHLTAVSPLLWAILGLALVLRIPNLTESFWFDEIWATHLKVGSIDALVKVAQEDNHPPLYYALAYLWIKPFGDSELSARMLPLLCGLGSVVLTFLLATRFFESRTALLAAFLMAVSPVHIWYSQEARLYSFMVFFLLLAIYASFRLRDTPRSTAFTVTYAASVLILVMTHYYMLLYVALLPVLALLYAHPARRRILAMHLLAAVPIAVFVTWRLLYFSLTPTGSGFLRPFTPAELWMLFFNWFLTANAIWTTSSYGGLSVIQAVPAVLAVQLLFAAIFARGLVRVVMGSPRPLELPGYLFALPLMLLVLPLLGRPHSYIERAALVVLPFFCLVLARGALGFRWRPLSHAALAAVLAINLAALGLYYARDGQWTVYKHNPDWSSLAAHLRQQERAGAAPHAVFVTVQPLELFYYLPGSRQVERPRRSTLSPSDLSDQHTPALAIEATDRTQPCEVAASSSVQRFYLLNNRYWTQDFDTVLETLQRDPRCQTAELTSFKGLDLYAVRVLPTP